MMNKPKIGLQPSERHLRRPILLFAAMSLLMAIASVSARAEEYHVATDGVDDAQRDGRSRETAWGSLAFACRQVPEGEHTIRLGPGTFVATETARPKSGVTLAGHGQHGEEATRLIASPDWALSETPCEGEPVEEFLIALRDVEQVTVRNLVLASRPEHRITGAIYCRDGSHITLRDLTVRDFRWAGLMLTHSDNLNVHHCTIENASTQKCHHHGGLIRTRWIKDSRLHHNRVVSTVGEGYGYKGGGHEGVRIDHNHFDIRGGFAIESAHENEYGVEIDHNYANRCISIPKSGQGADPSERGYEHSFYIHHNVLTDSYTIEGPRNHLRVSHNYIRIEKPNGRVYTHHGGENHGPIWIHHNVVVGIDRGFVWMNYGLAENLHIYNNTVFCAEAGERAGHVLGAYSGDRLNNWVFKNNIVIAPDSQPRQLYEQQRGVPENITATDNLFVNVKGVPEDNHTGDEPGLQSRGEKPWPFYAPAGAESFVVDRGVTVGLPYSGQAPDLGAYEFGDEWVLGDVPAEGQP